MKGGAVREGGRGVQVADVRAQTSPDRLTLDDAATTTGAAVDLWRVLWVFFPPCTLKEKL